MASIYEVSVNGSVVDAQLDGIELDFVANGQHTFTFPMALDNTDTRPTLGQQVILTENGTAIFKGPISAVPEQGEGGPNLDRVILNINATSHFIYTTYRYVTATIPAGTLKAALTAMLAATPTFAGITLDPSQVDGPDIPELTFTRTRFDEALQQLSDLSGGYLADVEPVNLYLRMYAPGTDSAPFDLLDSDTGDQKQVGDLIIEPTYDDNYANRVIMVISGGGPATSTESFSATGGATDAFQTAYPASQNINDLWPNVLIVDGVTIGPVGWGASTFPWSWDYVNHTLQNDGTGFVPTVGQVVTVGYAIGYPFTLTRDNTGAQVAPIYIRERLVEVQDAMTLDTATAYADAILAKRSISFKQATFASWKTGWRIGQTMTINIAARSTNATFLITDVKMIRESNAGPEQDCFMRYEITALEGTTTQANWRDVPKSWLGGGAAGASGSGGTEVGASGSSRPSLPLRSVQFNDLGAFGGSADLLFDKNGSGDTYGVSSRPARVALGSSESGPTSAQLAIFNTLAGLAKALLVYMGDTGALQVYANGPIIDLRNYVGSIQAIAKTNFEIDAGAPADGPYYGRMGNFWCHDGQALRQFLRTDDYTIDATIGSGLPIIAVFLFTIAATKTCTLPTIDDSGSLSYSTMPAPPYGRAIWIKNDSTSSDDLTLAAASGETIDGNASLAIPPGGGVFVTMVAGAGPAVSGAEWKILASYGLTAGGGGGGTATRAITFAVDGGGADITTGIKADVLVPYACTISKVTMLADQSGSIVVDIWKDAYSAYPPTGADSITASAKPTITSAVKSQDGTLTGWSTTINAGDTLRFNVDSCTGIQRLALTLEVAA